LFQKKTLPVISYGVPTIISSSKDGPFIEFCRQALELTKLRDMCTRAIKTETIAIQHKVIASSMLEGAAGAQNKEGAFESSFRDMCYLLQLFVKGIHRLKVEFT
jgi:hypothetical protein